MSVPLDQIPAPHGAPQLTLVDQLVQWGRRRIDERVFRPGMRMPSIRKLALDKGVSRFTVVEAYERLVAHGLSRFSARLRVLSCATGGRRGRLLTSRPLAERAPAPSTIDVVWLLRNMLHTSSPAEGVRVSAICLARWLDGELLTNALRSMSRQSGAQMLGFGTPQGFLPLRQQLQTRLEELEIGASTEQIVMVSGMTQAIDLISRIYVKPGDTVIVGDPAWFQMFGRFVSQGARLVGMPYTPDGPDLDALEAHGADLAPENARHQFGAAESDRHVAHRRAGVPHPATCRRPTISSSSKTISTAIYARRAIPATRLASLDQLKRVIFLGSFSKTLAPNLRVGYVAARRKWRTPSADQKMLVGMTSPELNERVLYKVLTEGHYRRHVERLRARLDGVREKPSRMLEKIGCKLFLMPSAGMFLWADTGVDSEALAAAGHEAGFLLTPGSLFSPHQSPSTWMRFNIANCGDPGLPAMLCRYLGRASRGAPLEIARRPN